MITFSAHCDGIGNTNGVELPRQHALFLDRVLDELSKVVDCINSSINSAEGSWSLKPLTMRAAVRQRKDFLPLLTATYLQGFPSHHTVATPT